MHYLRSIYHVLSIFCTSQVCSSGVYGLDRTHGPRNSFFSKNLRVTVREKLTECSHKGNAAMMMSTRTSYHSIDLMTFRQDRLDSKIAGLTTIGRLIQLLSPKKPHY